MTDQERKVKLALTKLLIEKVNTKAYTPEDFVSKLMKNLDIKITECPNCKHPMIIEEKIKNAIIHAHKAKAPWTKWEYEQKRKLIDMRTAGKSWKEIGTELNRTSQACFMMYDKINKTTTHEKQD